MRETGDILLLKKQAETVFQRCLFSKETRSGERKIPLKSYDELFHFTLLDLPVGPSGDLIVFHKEFCDLSEQDVHSLLPIVMSRSQALRWALRPTLVWDKMNFDHLYPIFEQESL